MQRKVEVSSLPPENLSRQSSSVEGEGSRALQEAAGLSTACGSAAQVASLLSPSKASEGKKRELLFFAKETTGTAVPAECWEQE